MKHICSISKQNIFLRESVELIGKVAEEVDLYLLDRTDKSAPAISQPTGCPESQVSCWSCHASFSSPTNCSANHCSDARYWNVNSRNRWNNVDSKCRFE